MNDKNKPSTNNAVKYANVVIWNAETMLILAVNEITNSPKGFVWPQSAINKCQNRMDFTP